MSARRQRKHWYYQVHEYCFLGGHTDTYRERRYGSRPKLWKNRNEIHEHACYGCMYESFL